MEFKKGESVFREIFFADFILVRIISRLFVQDDSRLHRDYKRHLFSEFGPKQVDFGPRIYLFWCFR